MTQWNCVLELDADRGVAAGGEEALLDAVRGGADLRIGTSFRHNEHIDTSSDNGELIAEQMDFRVTYVLDNRWVAAIETLRMPIELPDGFGPRASMSFFLYNQDGSQAIARPYLDNQPTSAAPGRSQVQQDPTMPKMVIHDTWDAGTNAPSSNFFYRFEYFRFFVRSGWREVLAHDEQGRVISGSVDDLAQQCRQGREVKVAIRGLCADLADNPSAAADHEVFVHIGPCYFYTERKLLMGAAHPLVRVRPAIPLAYSTHNWDFGWLMPRTDGHVARWLCDPYTFKFTKSSGRYAMRWFVNH